MAFTSEERARIRMALGFPAVNRGTDVALEGAMAVVDTDAASEALAREILTELGEVDASLAEARGRLKALRVDDVTLPGPEEIRTLRAEGRRLVARLGQLFNVVPRGGAYGAAVISGTIGRA